MDIVHIYKDYTPRVTQAMLCGVRRGCTGHNWTGDLNPLFVYKTEIMCEKCVDLLPPLVVLANTEL